MPLRPIPEGGGGRARVPGHTYTTRGSPLSKVDGRRRQPANAARPPRARPPRTSAMTWVETPPPPAAIGIRRTQLDTVQPKRARRGCYTHTGAACAVAASCPFPGFLGRVERGWHLETVAPRRGAANPPLAPDLCVPKVGWGLRAAALREGRPHTPAVWWVRVRWLWFCAELLL